MTCNRLKYEVANGILTLTLNRPDRLSSLKDMPPFCPWWQTDSGST